MTILQEGDFFANLKVTKTTKHFCFFDKTRLSWSQIQKRIDLGEKPNYQYSPNIELDWSKRDAVLQYYSSFLYWSTYHSGTTNQSVFHKAILDVKDNLVSFNNEYYLPSPVSKWINNQHLWNGKADNIEDGRYNIKLVKQENRWFAQTKPTGEYLLLNFFIPGSKVDKKLKDLRANREDLWCGYNSGEGVNFDYDHSIMHGLSFSLKSFSIEQLFKKYYINHPYNGEKYIELSDKELTNILEPIECGVKDILNRAICNNQFENLESEWQNRYGEFDMPYQLKFTQAVSKTVFTLIDTHISKQP